MKFYKYIGVLLCFILSLSFSTHAEEMYVEGWTKADTVIRATPVNGDVIVSLPFNTFVSCKEDDGVNDGWREIKLETGEVGYIEEKYLCGDKDTPLSPYRDIIDNLSAEEKDLIYRITYLEAGDHTMDGQRAVIEVILNRVISEKYPNTVTGVLSQKGQFTTWKMRNGKRANYNQQQIQALELVKQEPPLLNFNYLYFNGTKFKWAKNYVRISKHWFGTP